MGRLKCARVQEGEQPGRHQHHLARRGDAWTRTKWWLYRWRKAVVSRKISCPLIGPVRETLQDSSVDPWLLTLSPHSCETALLWSSLRVGHPAPRMDVVHLTHGYPPSMGVMCPWIGLPAADSTLSHWYRSLERPGPMPSFLVFCLLESAQCQGPTSVLLQHALPLQPSIHLRS